MVINDINNENWFLIFLLCTPLLFLIIGVIVYQMRDFSRELKYLNSEINRTEGGERKGWIRQRRRLWLSLIPFVKY